MLDDLLYPVIFSVPVEITDKKGRDRVTALSEHARKALLHAAAIQNVDIKPLKKGSRSEPLPTNGIYWSLSHKKKYVCGVVNNESIGIDVEEVSNPSSKLFDRIASKEEWSLFRERNRENFTRLWTAKEAVLKATGIGISGLRKSRLVEVRHFESLIIEYQNTGWIVSQTFHDNHVFSVTSGKKRVKWVKKGISPQEK